MNRWMIAHKVAAFWLAHTLLHILLKIVHHVSKQSMTWGGTELCRLFLDELKVMDMLRTFQQYFFMAAGDWAENLTEAVCVHTAQRGTLHEHSMQSMVDSSLKGTSVELDTNAANLKATLKVPSSQMPSRASQKRERTSQTSGAVSTSSEASQSTEAVQQLPSSCQAPVIIDGSQLKALDAVQLSYDVQWPLRLIVTQVQLYKAPQSKPCSLWLCMAA